MRGISVPRWQQAAHLKDMRAELPEYAEIHRHIVQQHVRTRLDRAFHAFFRRVTAGEKPGSPRFKARTRWHSLTYKEYGTGARLDNGWLVLARIGQSAVCWSRPLEGRPRP
jgi:putative transposase